MKTIFFSIIFILPLMSVFSQDVDSVQIKKFFDDALNSKISYNNLSKLCKETAGRICGTQKSLDAVYFTKKMMEELKFDTVYLQELMVPHWIRGEKETSGCTLMKTGAKYIFNVSALGMSIGTGKKGITAEIIEVKSFDDLKALGEKEVSGKIVFFNKEAEQSYVLTFRAYGEIAGFRSRGAIEAAKYGAVGVVVRSATLAHDEYPHTGVMRYDENIKKIPAVAIATNHADTLSMLLKKDKKLIFHFKTNCETKEDVKSYNVIGEFCGSAYPDEFITVGGHIDAWDNGGEGAHDDGCGCMQAMEVIRIFKACGFKPKRTIRAVMFMDEEIAQRGGRKYAEEAVRKNEKHIAAIESDAGCMSPRGFSMDAGIDTVNKFIQFKKYFEPYGMYEFRKGYGGVDISFLKKNGTPLIGLMTDNQRYFDFHHCAFDTFDKINRREMQMGSAAIAGLVYLIDKYGL
ncbi:MAG: hypothetical protein A2275_07475 [Bacteroidetes bacterium RIFOXYA12_FULL_35_11]|nr:MAG: hypothetical protein A2X01_04285 [Bacteroidetes bacterium GWF2_35_48]OFY73129.1 MAG: hypothetical protein A2275_07475 [Bacteroidetes bacterium RIFOXYA12_FULL_35_11]HBX51569.1 peptidase M28 family protein [Bacteroidales bacterium]